jgi:hypothetical protein
MDEVGVEVMGFTAMDLVGMTYHDDNPMSDAEAEKFLQVMGSKFRDRLTEEGFEILSTMVTMYRDEVANG